MLARLVPGRADLAGLATYLAGAATRAGAEIHLGVEATTVEAIVSRHPDVVVIATGARPGVPAVPGIEQSPAVDAFTVLGRPAGPVKRALVMGGGMLGVAVAHVLAARGGEVVIVEPGGELAAELGVRPRWQHVANLRARPNVTIILGGTVEELYADGALVRRAGEDVKLQGLDLVVPTRPMVPVSDLGEALITFSTHERRKLTPPERDLVLKSILYADEHRQYQLYAACVMPDHVHLLFEPQIKEQDRDGKPVFWSLTEILQGIKSVSAHNINKSFGQTGHVWEQESLDRMIRGQTDLEEKFHYICRNPWEAGVVQMTENYPWVWSPEPRAEARVGAVDEASTAAREARALPPQDGSAMQVEQIQLDIAFRVIADHIRTLSFAIADGIQPGNNDRNYVLRRILRRAVRYGRTLGFHEPFFYKLVDVLADTMGDVFPEIRARKKHVQETIQREEEAFNKTLDTGN